MLLLKKAFIRTTTPLHFNTKLQQTFQKMKRKKRRTKKRTLTYRKRYSQWLQPRQVSHRSNLSYLACPTRTRPHKLNKFLGKSCPKNTIPFTQLQQKHTVFGNANTILAQTGPSTSKFQSL